MKTRSSFQKNLIGFVFNILGISVLYFFLPTSISLGLFVVLFHIWLVSLLICTGTSILLQLGLKTYMKTSLVGTILILLVGAIFATPLSFDFKLLLVNIVLVILVLLSRYNLRKSKQVKAKTETTGNSKHTTNTNRISYDKD